MNESHCPLCKTLFLFIEGQFGPHITLSKKQEQLDEDWIANAVNRSIEVEIKRAEIEPVKQGRYEHNILCVVHF